MRTSQSVYNNNYILLQEMEVAFTYLVLIL